VSASVLFDGTNYRLMVASAATGTAAAPVFTDGGDGLDLANPANIKVPAKDAIAVIDGVEITRGKNVIDDAVAGLTFTLASAHPADDLTASTQVQVTLDTAAMFMAVILITLLGMALYGIVIGLERLLVVRDARIK